MSDDHRREEEDAVRTPAWLPVLGIVLFFCLVLYMLVAARPSVDATVQAPRAAQAADQPAQPGSD